jgi:CRP-like cAMP-binding protein
MSSPAEVALVSLLGLGTTSSAIGGAAIGLYAPMSKRMLACILAFSAGALISALAIELAYEGAQDLHRQGFSTRAAWAFVGGGFAIGAVFYYCASLFLEKKGGAVRYQTRFREYARDRKRQEAKDTIALLSKCDFLRHLPAEEVEDILRFVRNRHLAPGEALFRAGDPGNALFLVARGNVEVLAEISTGESRSEHKLATLGAGQAFGEMALLSGGPRTATVRSVGETDLLEIVREDFEQLVASDDRLADALQRLSHDRAITNLSAGGPNPATWAKVASGSLDQLSRAESNKLLAETCHGAGLAIVLGNILDTIPGCLVIGAKFSGMASLSLTLMLGMFLGGIPEAAASAAMLRKGGYQDTTIFALWSAVLVAGVVAAAAGKLLVAGADSEVAIFSQALAGGAVLALISHAMIPEAIDDGGSLVVLPTVAGFLFALYLALEETFV